MDGSRLLPGFLEVGYPNGITVLPPIKTSAFYSSSKITTIHDYDSGNDSDYDSMYKPLPLLPRESQNERRNRDMAKLAMASQVSTHLQDSLSISPDSIAPELENHFPCSASETSDDAQDCYISTPSPTDNEPWQWDSWLMSKEDLSKTAKSSPLPKYYRDKGPLPIHSNDSNLSLLDRNFASANLSNLALSTQDAAPTTPPSSPHAKTAPSQPHHDPYRPSPPSNLSKCTTLTHPSPCNSSLPSSPLYMSMASPGFGSHGGVDAGAGSEKSAFDTDDEDEDSDTGSGGSMFGSLRRKLGMRAGSEEKEREVVATTPEKKGNGGEKRKRVSNALKGVFWPKRDV